ncbi:MAG TPA: hypothetical protein VF006_24075 [Longimicrobium sp.]
MRPRIRTTTGLLASIVLLALLTVLPRATPTPAAAAVTGTYDLVLLRVQFPDLGPRYTRAQLNAAAAEMHRYFGELSSGQLDLRVHVAEVSLPKRWSDYAGCTGPSCTPILQDAAERAAAGGVSFAGVEGILVVYAGCPREGGGSFGAVTFTRPGVSGTFQQSDAAECGAPRLASGVEWGVWAHETGHQLQLHEGRSGAHPTWYESGYNLMDSCYPCGESAYSLADASLTNETGAAGPSLVFPGWIPRSRIHVTSSAAGAGETVVLAPVTAPLSGTAAALGIKVPISTGQYYFLEVRRRSRADAWPTIHDEGVQIIRIDEAAKRPGVPVHPCDTLHPDGCIRGADPRCPVPYTASSHPHCWPFALWHTSDTYRDAANAIAISVGPAAGDGLAVTVTRGVPRGAPDLFVTPWRTPPVHGYETVDIWVDSSCNGYEADGGALRYGRRADGTVIGNGDDPCANHPNRVYARVRNLGDAPARDARIVFEAADPLGMGISGTWREIGTAAPAAFPALASIPAGGEATVFVEWTPAVTVDAERLRDARFAFHSCLRVRAAGVAGERVLQNLDGDGEQENLDNFEVPAGSGAGAAASEREFRLTNPPDTSRQARTYYFMVDSRLPKDWRYEVAGGAQSITLQPGESRRIPVRVVSRGRREPGASWHLRVAAYTIERHVPPPYVRTGFVEYLPRVEGGVTFAAQGVRKAKMRMRASLSRGRVVVEGRLDPAVAGTRVTVDYAPAEGRTVSRLVATDRAGRFRDASVQADGREWRVLAFWQGTDRLSSAATDVVAPGSAQSGGMPGRWWIVVLLLVVVLVLVWWYVRSRR